MSRSRKGSKPPGYDFRSQFGRCVTKEEAQAAKFEADLIRWLNDPNDENSADFERFLEIENAIYCHNCGPCEKCKGE